MKIAVFGSWKQHSNQEWKLKGSKEIFEQACLEIGEQIASYKHTVLVASDSEKTADYHIVAGILNRNIKSEIPLIKVSSSSDKGYSFEKLASIYPDLFAFFPEQPFWEAKHVLSIKEADIVLILGGGRASYHAGIASIVSGKKVIPIGSFGGAGEKVLDIIESMLTIDEDKTDLLKLRNPWNKNLTSHVVNLMRFTKYPQIFIVHGRSKDYLYLKDYLQNNLKLPEPIIMNQKFEFGKALPNKFEELANRADGAIILATPDDIGGLKIKENQNTEMRLRTRQNVWLETGWFWGKFGGKRLMILCKDNVEIPSDLQGIELYYYQETPQERSVEILNFVEKLK